MPMDPADGPADARHGRRETPQPHDPGRADLEQRATSGSGMGASGGTSTGQRSMGHAKPTETGERGRAARVKP